MINVNTAKRNRENIYKEIWSGSPETKIIESGISMKLSVLKELRNYSVVVILLNMGLKKSAFSTYCFGKLVVHLSVISVFSVLSLMSSLVLRKKTRTLTLTLYVFFPEVFDTFIFIEFIRVLFL